MAVISDLFIDQGTDFSTTITISNLDLSGYQIASQMRKLYSSSSAVPFVATIPTATAQQGIVKLELAASTSSGMKPGRYVYDIELTNPNGKKSRPIKGLVVIDPEVTR